MPFGAYPLQHERMSMSLSRPLLDEDGLSSEASEDLAYEPKSTFLSQHGRKSRMRRLFSPRTLVALAVGVVLFILGVQSVLLWKLWRQSAHPEALGEFNGLVPSVRTEPRLFAPDPNFDALNASDPGWLSIMPMGGGFVPIQNWQGKAVPEPIRTHGMDLYNVAVFHQLHCLHMIAEDYSKLLTSRHMGDNRSQRDGHGGHGEGVMLEHVRHCFEYIKSSLTCCVDTALEGQKSDSKLPGTDGFGAYHVCRDFDAVFDWAETHRASDMRGYPH